MKAGADAEIHFVLQAPQILKQGVAETLHSKEGGRTIREFIDEALGLGVKFYVCDTALALCDMTSEDLIEENRDPGWTQFFGQRRFAGRPGSIFLACNLIWRYHVHRRN